MNSKIIFILSCLFFTSQVCDASIRAVATTPDIAWLIKRVGGNEVEAKVLSKASDNYHFLDARPDYILAVNRADIVCKVGAELEIGWLPKILEKAANTKVMDGGAGDCDLSREVSLLEKPNGKVDRSMGDVHGAGNPHFWLSPHAMIEASKEVETRLSAVAPQNAKQFAQNRNNLEKELNDLQTKIRSKLKAASGKVFYQYHKDFTYFFSNYGLISAGSIEEIPGVSPSAARLGKVALEAKQKASGAIAMASEHDPKPTLNKFQESSGVPVIVVPTSLSNSDDPSAYAKWQESLADSIIQAISR